MTDPDFELWRADVSAACLEAGTSVPQDHVLGFMFDDGLEPPEAAQPAVQARYHPKRSRTFGFGAADLMAERHTRPD